MTLINIFLPLYFKFCSGRSLVFLSQIFFSRKFHLNRLHEIDCHTARTFNYHQLEVRTASWGVGTYEDMDPHSPVSPLPLPRCQPNPYDV